MESPKLRRAAPEYQRWITQIISNIIMSNKHRRCFHEHDENIVDLSPMCLVHLHRMFADYFALLGGISPKALGDKTSRENFNACITILLLYPDALAKHGDYSRTSPIIKKTMPSYCYTSCTGVANQMHREA